MSAQTNWDTKTRVDVIAFQKRVAPLPEGPTSSTTVKSTVFDKKQTLKGSASYVGGWRPPTPYRAYSMRCELHPYDYVGKGSGSYYYRHWGANSPVGNQYGCLESTLYYGSVNNGVDRLPSVNDNLQNRCLVECLLKIRDQKVNLSLMFAEARKSVDTVLTRLLRLLEALRALKRRNWAYFKYTRLKVQSRKGGDLWLEYQYGWKPLLSDIFGSAEAAIKLMNGVNPYIYAVRKVSEVESPPRVPKPGTGLTVWQPEGQSTQGCCIRLDYNVSASWLHQASSLGLVNPLELAWELVPYSFVIDWLVPIGNWLASLTADVGLEFKTGTRSTISKQNFQVRYAGRGSTVQPPTGEYSRVSVSSMYIRRDVLSQVPLRIPYIRSPFSTTRMTSALALLSEAQRRR